MPSATVPAAITGCAVVLAAQAIRRREARPVDRLLGRHSVERLTRVPVHRRVLVRLGRFERLRRTASTLRLERRLALAGHRGDIDAFLGSKVGWAVGGALLAVLAATVVPAAVAVVPIAIVAGFRGPEVALARKGRRRQQEVAAHVADLVEVLVATTEAGLSPAVALRRSVEIMRGPLGDELGVVIREIDLGAPWRDALERLLERTDAPPLRRLVASLTRSQRLGASIGAGLRSLADDVRAERRARAEEAARRAPVKMLFPLVFLILPAFLLLTVGPAVLATLRSLH